MSNLKKLSRQETEEQIKNIFKSEEISTPKQIKEIKKLAMSENIKLRGLRKKFCKKCLTFFTPNNSEIRIKNGFKMVRCKSCGYVGKYKLS